MENTIQTLTLGCFKSRCYNPSTCVVTYTFWDMEIVHKDYTANRSHQSKSMALKHCGGFNTEKSANVEWKEYWIKNIVFEFATKKNSDIPVKLQKAYIEVADVVPFALLEAETTKNGNLKPQLIEFKSKLPDTHALMRS
jgi:hypothetical protein